jgi:hypothetical protein
MSLTVAQCDTGPNRRGRVVWKVDRASSRVPPPLFIVYGQLPTPDWKQSMPPEPLHAGCYAVYSTGGGIGARRVFEIKTDLSVHLPSR